MIRKITIKDKNDYISMAREFYSTVAELKSIPDDKISKTFNAIVLGRPYVDGYIYEYNGKTAGYILLSITYSNEVGGNVLWIEEVYILPEFRNHGFGKELFSFIENTYKDQVEMIRVEVEKTNERAVSLYQKIGFTELKYMQMYKTI